MAYLSEERGADPLGRTLGGALRLRGQGATQKLLKRAEKKGEFYGKFTDISWFLHVFRCFSPRSEAFFCNSGTEANEAAIKRLARGAKGLHMLFLKGNPLCWIRNRCRMGSTSRILMKSREKRPDLLCLRSNFSEFE